ncbi:DUF922 domain-containing protein [Oricola sp.]|uniref:DUF922 domain-containing protein n=1 Tax=Oricola sp. TaxID=1979950 RepID=UPI003BADA308
MPRFASARFGFVAAISILLAGCTSTTTEPRVSTSYYTISGLSGAELDREISRKGPMRGHALAATAIRFIPVSIEYDETASGCRFSEATFRVDANVTLPRWREQTSTKDDDLRIAWKFLSEYAREHEAYHVYIAEKHARKLGAALLTLRSHQTCEALDRAAEAAMKKVRAAHDREQLAFDAAEKKRLARLFGS